MAKFGEKSLAQRATLHPDLQKVVDTTIAFFGFSITEGARTQATQRKYFLEGRSKVDWPAGAHCKIPSDAFDFLPDTVSWDDLNGVNGKAIQQKAVATCYYLAGAFIAVGHMRGIKVRSGADWDMDTDLQDQNFNDIVHLERVR